MDYNDDEIDYTNNQKTSIIVINQIFIEQLICAKHGAICPVQELILLICSPVSSNIKIRKLRSSFTLLLPFSSS